MTKNIQIFRLELFNIFTLGGDDGKRVGSSKKKGNGASNGPAGCFVSRLATEHVLLTAPDF